MLLPLAFPSVYTLEDQRRESPKDFAPEQENLFARLTESPARADGE